MIKSDALTTEPLETMVSEGEIVGIEWNRFARLHHVASYAELYSSGRVRGAFVGTIYNKRRRLHCRNLLLVANEKWYTVELYQISHFQ